MATIYQEATGPFGWEYIERVNEDGSVSVIPKDLGNTDYQTYLEEQANDQSL